VVGQICYIYAASDDGPRGKPGLTAAERNSPDNLILMCGHHHPLVDKQWETYPAQLLKAWKKAHEAQFQQGTAEALKLSQPTIARRLAAFEATSGGPTLFDRLPEGLRLNAAGEQLVPAAESVEDAVLTLERRRAAASPVLSGAVRISTGECAAGSLARCLSGSTTTALPSGITLELVESRQTANLARREADMALRHHPPESGDFYIAKAGTFACAVYRRSGADADAWVT
jgi:DNA-binding transcriptional LysR family regulator